jgi:hypothetical protein
MPARGRLRKRLLWIGLALLFVLLASIGAALYFDRQNERELREAEGEADCLDSGWRLQDLEGNREPVPDADNSALQILAAAALVPATWPTPPPPAPDPKLEDRLWELNPQARPDKKLLDAAKVALQQVRPAVDLARRIADYPHGRFAIAWTPDIIGTPVNHVQSVGTVKRLLYFDTLLRAEDGDTEGAARSCLAALNAGRSLGDEPIPISQYIRAHCQHSAERAVERLLAQSQLSRVMLNKLQHEFAQEAAQPLLLRAFRSDRAWTHEFLTALKEGRFNRRGLRLANPFGLPDQAINLNDALRARTCHAVYLRYLTQLVEIAKLPPEQQGPRLQELRIPPMIKPTVYRLLELPETELRRIHRLLIGSLTVLRCAVTGLAIERYRRDTGRWPDSPGNLVPQYLAEEQLDPFDGAALRYRRLEDGVVIYSVGPDRKDHGGRLTREIPPPEGADLGFCLWDPSKRRQPASFQSCSTPP